MLPDEVLKEIEKGPRNSGTTPFPHYETTEEFATRIAELATKLEREACVRVCSDLYNERQAQSRFASADHAAQAIEARGRKA